MTSRDPNRFGSNSISNEITVAVSPISLAKVEDTSTISSRVEVAPSTSEVIAESNIPEPVLVINNPGSQGTRGQQGIPGDKGEPGPPGSGSTGLLRKDVTGDFDVFLTSDEYNNAIFEFYGTINSDIFVVVPPTSKILIVLNRTSGSGRLTICNPTGPGITVSQNTQQDLVSNGEMMATSRSEFNNITVSGESTAETPPTTDRSNRIATTAFVKDQGYITRAQAPVQSVFGRTGNVTLETTDLSTAMNHLSLDGGTF